MFILCFIYFVPACIFIVISYDEIKDSMDDTDSPLSLFTFGALIFKNN